MGVTPPPQSGRSSRRNVIGEAPKRREFLRWLSVVFACPMDPDIRSKGPGRCTKCGMRLEAGIPEPVEYPLELRVAPRHAPAGPVQLEFRVRHPKTGKIVRDFETVHEKLFHLFLVSQDLSFFAHEHPVYRGDGVFRHSTTLPKPGLYRVLCDYYPVGGTPQLTPLTLTTAGYTASIASGIAKHEADLSPKQCENLDVEISLETPRPIAGKKTFLFFRFNPQDGIEPYLGAWGHMLAVSDDLIDMVHAHPSFAEGKPPVQFDVFFPREAVYRIWVQFQRKGVVNTAAFTVPVFQLR